MAFMDKVSKFAGQAVDKAGQAVETGKITLKIKEEEKSIKDSELKIGQLIVEKLDDGQEFDERITDLYKTILAARENIVDLKEEQAKVGEAPAEE